VRKTQFSAHPVRQLYVFHTAHRVRSQRRSRVSVPPLLLLLQRSWPGYANSTAALKHNTFRSRRMSVARGKSTGLATFNHPCSGDEISPCSTETDLGLLALFFKPLLSGMICTDDASLEQNRAPPNDDDRSRCQLWMLRMYSQGKRDLDLRLYGRNIQRWFTLRPYIHADIVHGHDIPGRLFGSDKPGSI